MVEGDRGEVVHTYIPTRKPVEAYLKLRGRFRHLFEPNRQDEPIRRIQEWVDA
jgi:pyruvate ferredoxin oxidoreductase beta subunit